MNNSPDSTPVGQAMIEVCTFLVNEHCFAILSSNVEEVLETDDITRVPLAIKEVAGLIHLRGHIVPVINMRERLSVGLSQKKHGKLLIIRVQNDWYALLVDTVLEIKLIPTDRIEPPSVQHPHVDTDARTGIFAGENMLVHLLHPESIVQCLLKNRRPLPFPSTASSS